MAFVAAPHRVSDRPPDSPRSPVRSAPGGTFRRPSSPGSILITRSCSAPIKRVIRQAEGTPTMLSHLLTVHAAIDVVRHLLDATPTPAPTPKSLNTEGILGFFASRIAPIGLAFLGLIFVGRARRGEVSQVMTSSTIALIGVAFIAGATALVFVGDSLVKLVIQ